MQSLLLTDAEASKEADYSQDKPKYPYGTSLYLNKDALAKLGMATLPAIGTEMMLTARVTVTSVSQNESLEGGNDMNLELQMTEADLTAVQETRTDLDRANSLYGDAG